MLPDLDETLKALLLERGALDASQVDVSFDIPTREWSGPVTRPTINLYLYDVRENLKLREMGYTRQLEADGRGARLKRLPLRVDVSYIATCWTSSPEDQHSLLWRVLETFARHRIIPRELLRGELVHAIKDITLEAAQPDGVLRNLSDLWGALGNQLRPAINLVVTVELDLAQSTIAPLVFGRVLRTGRAHPTEKRLDEGSAIVSLEVGGQVRSTAGQPVPGVSIRLLGGLADGRAVQVGERVMTDAQGRYLLRHLQPGRYTLEVEAPGNKAVQHALHLEWEEGQTRLQTDLTCPVDVA